MPSVICRRCSTEYPVEADGTHICPGCGDEIELDLGLGSDPGRRRRPEKDEERALIELYSALGCCVWKTSQPQRARGMSRGLPDLVVFRGDSSAPEPMWFHECKSPDVDARRAQSDDQRRFEEECDRAGVPYLLGGVSAAADFLELS